MSIIRAAAVSALALFTIVQSAGSASADHRLRMRVLWPKIYAPHISGYLYRDELDEEDSGFFDLEDEQEMLPRRRDRNVVLQYDDEDWLEPQYEPPVKKAVKPKTKPVAKKPAVKSKQTAAAVVKPKVKPAIKSTSAVPVKAVATDTAIKAKVQEPSATAKTSPLIPSAQAASGKSAPQTVVAKPASTPVKTASAAAPAAKAAGSAGSIGCSKGAEIVSGYGFTSVKPRACTGATYTFDATRAANAYLIKVSAATGEISDVQKLR